MTKMESSSNLINNLLLNLDNLKLQAENKTDFQDNVSFNIQEQLEMLKSETQKLTKQYQYTQPSTNKNNKSKKIPPPIITGQYKKKSNSQYQTIDDLLLELNNASFQAFGRTPAPRSGKSRKNQGSFIDPRRYSDPYKYTILSTLDETEDDEEEEENNISNTPRTPKTALPYYGRKNNKNNLSLTCNTNLKLASHLISPKSAGARLRSLSQPERYSSNKYLNTAKSSLHESSTLDTEKTSTKYLLNIKNSIMNEKKNVNIKQRKSGDNFIKPPRSSSINKHGNSIGKKEILKNYDDYSSGSEISDSEPNTEQICHYSESSYNKNNLGLENKSSFQSDVTLVNEEDE